MFSFIQIILVGDVLVRGPFELVMSVFKNHLIHFFTYSWLTFLLTLCINKKWQQNTICVPSLSSLRFEDHMAEGVRRTQWNVPLWPQIGPSGQVIRHSCITSYSPLQICGGRTIAKLSVGGVALLPQYYMSSISLAGLIVVLSTGT